MGAVALGTALLLLGAREAGAQRVLGPGDDAFVLPRGAIRIGASATWANFAERYGPTGDRLPLGADLSRAALGSADVTALAPVEQAVRTLSGVPSFALSLGAVRTSLDRSRTVTPFVAEYGLTSRITLGVMVPYVRTRTDVALEANLRGTSTANVGPNPALNATLASLARTQNLAVTTALRSAAAALQQQAAACQATPTEGNCPLILGSANEVAALIASAGAAATAIGQLYGDSTGRGAAYVPLRGSAAQTAIENRVKAINASFKTFLGEDRVTSTPFGAPVFATATDLQTLLADSAAGIIVSPLQTVERSHLGDVELAATVLVFDGFGRSEQRRFASTGLTGRVSVGGLVRLGTGQRDATDNLADFGTGDGQTDVEGRVAADLVAGRHLWLSLVGRYGVQLADRVMLRVPTAVGQPFTLASRLGEVDRNLGDYLEVEASPRWVVGDYFGLSAHWLYRRKGEDVYSGTFDAATPGGGTETADASVLGAETEWREQRVGVGATYSTLAAYDRGRGRLPFEISLVRTVAISGRNAPKVSDATIRMRVYTRLKRSSPVVAPGRR